MSNGEVNRKSLILAYSGGLDTSCILKWLIEEKNYDVTCYVANIGQNDDFQAIREKAKKVGAKDVIIDDVREQFVTDFIWKSVQAGLLYESRYLLGTSLARPLISARIIHYAKKLNAFYIAHGATGKGNDQIRFELSCYALWPQIKIIAPWRLDEFTERFQGRSDLLKYAQERGITTSSAPSATPPFSKDANLMHISYESGVLEDASQAPPSDLFEWTEDLEKASPDGASIVEIEFLHGIPKILKVFGQDSKNFDLYEKPLEILLKLNELGAKHSLGRIDIVENRFIGLKSRGVYETPGVYILHQAHLDLEIFSMDREVWRLKRDLALRYADFVYNGLWYAPETEFVHKCIEVAAEIVNGTVRVGLNKGNLTILGRWATNSNQSLYNEDLVSMDKHNDFSPRDATGFINIHALRLKEFHRFRNIEK